MVPITSTTAAVTVTSPNPPSIQVTTPTHDSEKLMKDGGAVPESSSADSIVTTKLERENSSKDAKLEQLQKQIEALAVPGYSISQDGVFTVIKRTQTHVRSGTFPARIARWLLNSDKWFPVMLRFTKQSFLLSPWRMALLIFTNSVKSVAPAARLWASSHMLTIVEEAIHSGHVDKMKLSIFVGLAAFISTGLRSVKMFFSRNRGILERKFVAMINSQLLEAVSRLDWLAATDPENTKLLLEASLTVQAGSDQAFKVVGDIVKVFTSLMGACTQAWLLKRTVTRHNVDLIVISFIASFVHTAEWLFRGDAGVHSGVTNVEYHRMQNIWNESLSRQPESALLGIPAYHASEYNKANERMGDLWTYRLKETSGLARATKLMHSVSEPVVYALFALRAAARRGRSRNPTSLFKEVFSTGALEFIKSSTEALAEEIGQFFFVLDDVRQHCSQVIQFYKALELKPMLKQPAVPAQYERIVLKSGDHDLGLKGMQIDFEDVSFRYPGSDRKALSDVSFTITPGSLVCIVGYNGSGKSSMINLMARIVDPTSGRVLINGRDAREYSTKDLYSRISCQFQHTFPADVTIREWLHMGDITETEDEHKMQECLRVTGADKIVARFPKGLDARLGPYPADDTPQSLLKEYIMDAETGRLDPWEDAYGEKISQEIEQEEDFEDEVIGSRSLKNKDCAFSPGEWSKLCFARTLMKRDADLRVFDEPSAPLDPIAARAVFDKIESLRGGCTVIHITHDLAACIKADQVILFDEGKNVESGTHEGLLAQPDSKYRQFYMASIGHGGDDNSEDDEEDDDSVDEEAAEEEDDDEDDGEDENDDAREEEQSADDIKGRGNPSEVRAQSASIVQPKVKPVEGMATTVTGGGDGDDNDGWVDEPDATKDSHDHLAKGKGKAIPSEAEMASSIDLEIEELQSNLLGEDGHDADSTGEEGQVEEDEEDADVEGEDSGFEGSSQSSVCADA